MLFKMKKMTSQECEVKSEPHFLFIITPPYSGSTALCELLNSSKRITKLQESGEGQWLIPNLCEDDRWDPNKEVDYSSVKAIWLKKYFEIKNTNKNLDVIIEKSPPNMMRIERLASEFKNFSFIANNRNPYANCASILYRKHDVDKLNSNQRKEIITKLLKNWVTRSLKIKQLIMKHSIPLMTYEKFCEDTSSILKILNLPPGVSETINLKANVKVKDYKIQPIINQNERQISKLTDDEIEYMRDYLIEYDDVIKYFGY